MRGAALFGVCLAIGTGACGSSSSTPKTNYVVVTVDARPAVHDAASITVALANAGTTRMDDLKLDGKTFPVTFSISAPGRTGDLAITVDASDQTGVVVGHGSTMATLTDDTATVLLDTTDFVVNTDYAGDQFPSEEFEAGGFQLAALPDGTWTTVFRDSCMQSACNVFARRFDRTGKPIATQAAAGTNAFVVTARASDSSTEATVASNQTSTVAIWNFTDIAPAPAPTGIACRAINAAGALGADQTSISNDTLGAATTAVALSSGDFVVSWNAIPVSGSGFVVRSAIIKPDCTAGAVQTVSTGTALADRNAVASSADHVMFSWGVGPDLHARMMPGVGAPLTADTVLIPHTATEQVAQARIAAVPGGGFALAVRWNQMTDPGPGRIELYQINAAGAVVGSPTPVTDQSSSGGLNDQGLGLASRPDGTVMVVWHVCSSSDMCTLSGRILKASGEPVTDAFAIPTTTGGSQKRPSVVGLPDAFAVVWSDTSGKPPDGSGQAVRARIVYPPAPPSR